MQRVSSNRTNIIQMRKAHQADFEFIWQLRITTMKTYVEQTYGWDDDTQRSYAEESLHGNILLVNGRPAGVVTLSDWGNQLHLTWMAVEPAFQRQGIGGEVINYCQQCAREAGKPLTLQVLRNNPAVSLYKRCGFEVYGENSLHKLLMRWTGDENSD